MTELQLPKGFENLQKYLEDWNHSTNIEDRYQIRQELPFARINAFYEAMAPRLEEVFAHLEKFPYGQLPAPEARLFNLTLGLAEAAQAVEVFEESCVPLAPPNHYVAIHAIPAAAGPLTRSDK